MNGQAIAAWLRANIDPSKIYDHKDLHHLHQVGIEYEPETSALSADGAFAIVATYTPAELMKHPIVKVHGIQDYPDRVVLGFEIAAAVHQLVWPAELPPGQPNHGWRASFERNVNSIAARDGLPYRDEPPGGWWRKPAPATTRRHR
jgi:hypothetical protein